MTLVNRRRPPLIVLLGATLLLAGCGGGGSSNAISTTDWANSVCSAITTWTSSLKSAGKSLQGGNLSKDSLKSAAKDIEDATSTFADDLKGLGKPNTETGQQAKESVDQLSKNIKNGADEIRSAVQGVSSLSDAQAALTTVGGTLQKMGTQVTSAFSKLGNLDPKGELKTAFKNADKCSSLVKGSS